MCAGDREEPGSILERVPHLWWLIGQERMFCRPLWVEAVGIARPLEVVGAGHAIVSRVPPWPCGRRHEDVLDDVDTSGAQPASRGNHMRKLAIWVLLK